MVGRARDPRPTLTADVAAFRVKDDRMEVLLVERRHAPFRGDWALPGGFVAADEEPEAAARRELSEETGVVAATLRLFGVFGRPGRDPRGHTVTCAYQALFPPPAPEPVAGDDAAAARWWPASAPPQLAFDHADVLAAALAFLQREATLGLAAFDLLPPRFSIEALRHVYQAIAGHPIGADVFAHRIRLYGILQDAETPAAGESRLYRLAPGSARLLALQSPLSF
ncbi:MAG: NUDIX hydrolase [Planctomycetes bacterium]|nr:NUDIX hydrolase [Planctomycetota bacterium]